MEWQKMSLNVSSPEKWQADYERGTDGWDLRGPTPVFKRLVSEGHFAPGRIFVPGAGRGHDAREFARRGFQVTAVDFTPYAIREMRRLADPSAPVDIRRHDLFALPREWDGSFDYVLEYTCFCAIDPERRAEYADVVTRLLRPHGIYIDLAFPLDRHTGGPPFAVSVTKVEELFARRGFKLVRQERPSDSVPARQGREQLLVFQKTGKQTASAAKQ
jgi:SAM-dependent methyltransferase